MTQTSTVPKLESAGRPRVEAAELSEALGLEDFSYWERGNPTFRGVFKGRVLTVEKRTYSAAIGQKKHRAKGQITWLELIKRYSSNASEFKVGQHMVLDWVVVVATPLTTKSAASQTGATKTAAPRATTTLLTLDEAVQQQSQNFLVGEAKTFTPGHGNTLLTQAKVQGHQYLLSLISDGSLVSSSDISVYWGITTQALGNRKRSGDVIGLMINNRLWYPAELKRFPTREDAERVCAELKSLASIEQFLILTNGHAALGGLKISEALNKGKRRDVDAFLGSLVTTA